MTPYIIRSSFSSGYFRRRIERFRNRQKYDIRLIDTEDCRNMSHVMARIIEAFVGYNDRPSVNAFVDMMSDLSWLDGDRFGIAIDDLSGLLDFANCQYSDAILEIQNRWRFDLENANVFGRRLNRFLCIVNSNR